MLPKRSQEIQQESALQSNADVYYNIHTLIKSSKLQLCTSQADSQCWNKSAFCLVFRDTKSTRGLKLKSYGDRGWFSVFCNSRNNRKGTWNGGQSRYCHRGIDNLRKGSDSTIRYLGFSIRFYHSNYGLIDADADRMEDVLQEQIDALNDKEKQSFWCLTDCRATPPEKAYN